MSSELSEAVVGGTFFTLLSRLVGNLSQVLIFVLLARLLTPDEFGLFAVVGVVFNLIVLLVTAGVSTLNIQLTNRTESTYGDVFWMAQAVCFVFMMGLILFTPLIARALGQGLDFQYLLLIFGSTLFLSVANTVQISEATRLFEYRKIFMFTAIPSGVAGILACCSAFFGMGVYALIINLALARLLSCLCFHLGGVVWPSFSWDNDLIRKLIRFSASVSLTNLFEELSRGLLVFIAGMQSTALAGLLNVGRQIPMFASSTINATIVSVAFPVFSKLSETEHALNRAFCQTLFSITLLLTPIIIIMVQHAEEIVVLLLGDKWAPSADFLKVFAVVYLTGFFPVLFTQILNARGKPGGALIFNFLFRGAVLISIGVSHYVFSDFNLVMSVYLVSHIVGLLVLTSWLSRRHIYKAGHLFMDVLLLTGGVCVFFIATTFISCVISVVGIHFYFHSLLTSVLALLLYFLFVFKINHPKILQLKMLGLQVWSRG